MNRKEITELSYDDIKEAITEYYKKKYPNKGGQLIVDTRYIPSGPNSPFMATITRLVPDNE